jgi:hypothetical protein
METFFVVIHFIAAVVISPVVRWYRAERSRNVVVVRLMNGRRAFAASGAGENESETRDYR